MKVKAINSFSGAKFSMVSGETRGDLSDEICADLIVTGYAESAEEKGEIPASVKAIMDKQRAARVEAEKAAVSEEAEKPLSPEERIAQLEAENEELKKTSAKSEEDEKKKSSSKKEDK